MATIETLLNCQEVLKKILALARDSPVWQPLVAHRWSHFSFMTPSQDLYSTIVNRRLFEVEIYGPLRDLAAAPSS